MPNTISTSVSNAVSYAKLGGSPNQLLNTALDMSVYWYLVDMLGVDGMVLSTNDSSVVNSLKMGLLSTAGITASHFMTSMWPMLTVNVLPS